MPRHKPDSARLPRAQASERPKAETPLSEWMCANDVTDYAVAKIVGVAPQTVSYWRNNQALPELVYARKLELLTEGEVSMVSWFGTPYGKYKYEQTK